MNTPPSPTIDERLRSLVVEIDAVTPPSPGGDELFARTQRVPRVRPTPVTPVRWRFAFVAATALCVVVAGLVLVNRRAEQPAADRDRLTTHALSTDVPDGWRLAGVTEIAVSENLEPPLGQHAAGMTSIHYFASDASPLGPIVAVTAGGLPPNMTADSGHSLTLPDGRAAAIGDNVIGFRQLDVRLADGSWIIIAGRNVADETLIDFAAGVGLDPDDPLATSSTPSGMTEIGTSDPYEHLPGSTATYTGPDGAGDITVQISPDSPTRRALLGLFGVAARSEIADDIIVSTQTYGTAVVRYEDGLAVSAEGDVAPELLLNLVDSVSNIASEAWSELVGSTTESPDPGLVVETTAPAVPSTVPATPDAPLGGGDVLLDYDVEHLDNTTLIRTTVEGHDVTIRATVVGRQVHIAVDDDGKQVATTDLQTGSGTAGSRFELTGLGHFAAWVMAPATSMIIYQAPDGRLIQAPAVDLAGGPDPATLAVIWVPDATAANSLIVDQSIWLVDAAGNPLG